MAAPSFVQASVGATDASGTFTFTGVAAGTIGDIVILQILNDGTGAINWGTLSSSNINDLAGSAGWTEIGIFFAGAAAQQRLFIGRRTSASSAPTFTAASNTSGDDVYGRMYEFTNVSAGTTLATVIENATAGGTTTSGVTSSNTASNASVQTLGSDRLALNFVAVNDDNAISQFSGETGGKWIQPTPYADSGGTDGAIAMQMAWISSLAAGPDYGVGGASAVQGGTGANEQVASTFTTSGALTLAGAMVQLSKAGSPTDNLIVEIQTDSGGFPSGSVVGSSGSIAAASLTTGEMPYRVALSATLSASTTYHIVCRRDGVRSTSNYFNVWLTPLSVITGRYQTRDNGTWSDGASDTDLAFGLLTATDISGNTIDGGTGSIVDIDAWGVVGFALIGTTASTPTSLLLPNQSSRIVRRPYPTR